MKRINKVSWFPIGKKGNGDEAVRLILNKKAMEQMGMSKNGCRDVLVEYDFKNKKIMVTPLLENEEGVMVNKITLK